MVLNKTQVDHLGQRLKDGTHTENDLRLLDEYRRSFGDDYEAVINTLRNRGLSPTGRPAKSTLSIVQKLRRESIRLSQVQDIGGCRIVVPNIAEQEQLVAALKLEFTNATVVDRRLKPAHGYRAVHVIANRSGRPIEIQVRSALQHMWAEVSEKASDVVDLSVKYGGGPEFWRLRLDKSAELIAAYEAFEQSHYETVNLRIRAIAAYNNLEAAYNNLENEVSKVGEDSLPQEFMQEMHARREKFSGDQALYDQEDRQSEIDLRAGKAHIVDALNELISQLEQQKGQSQ